MSLFKILRGDSSRLTSQPFHDGYAYFTPDDGGFYIDAEVDNEEKRIQINQKSAVNVIDDGEGNVVLGLINLDEATGSGVIS